MSHLGNEAFRKLIIGAAIASGADKDLVTTQLEQLETDAQRWRDFRVAWCDNDEERITKFAENRVFTNQKIYPVDFDAAADAAFR